MSVVTLERKRVLVVGASAGIGRAVAVRAVRSGADVVLAARRRDRLDAAVDEAGGGVAVVGDVCREDDCRRIVADAADAVGPLDLLVYAAGYAPLRPLADTDAAAWLAVLQTNVIGVNQVIRAAVPRMAPGGLVAVMSSEAANLVRFGLGAYGASKAALEASLAGWRIEHPEVRFTCLGMGATQPTEFGLNFTPESLGPAFEHWSRHGLLQEAFMSTDEVAVVLVQTLAAALAYPGVGVEHLALRSPSPVIGASDAGRAIADQDLGQRMDEVTTPPWVSDR